MDLYFDTREDAEIFRRDNGVKNGYTLTQEDDGLWMLFIFCEDNA